MKRIVFFVATFVCGVVAYAQGPKIEFKTETIDYGTVVKGEDNGIRVFEFTNTGDAPLVVKDVKSTCGCTVPEKPKEPIMPGKKGQIQVKYNMNPGNINRTVTVESNAVNAQDGKSYLRIKGTVVQKEDAGVMDKKKALPQS